MNRFLLLKKLLPLFLFLFSFSFLQGQTDKKPYVLVSVAPHRFFLEKVAGDTVDIGLIVPAGASAHTFEPSPKQMLIASRATMWFRIGESFEARAIHALKSHNPELLIVDMQKGLDLITNDPNHKGCCCHANAMDLHFWLSARMAKTQAKTMAEALAATYPQHAALYFENLKKFHEELDALDQQVTLILKNMKSRNILVSHPAYAYFCRDYSINQYSIEFEGKDPAPQQLNKTLRLARELRIQTVFIQKQYNNKGARLIADELKARLVTLDPYSEHFFNSMLDIAHAFAEG